MKTLRIEQITANNYRNLGQLEIKFPKNSEHDITTITGTNGAGKTNLIRALLWTLTGHEYPLFNSLKQEDTHEIFNIKTVKTQPREHTTV